MPFAGITAAVVGGSLNAVRPRVAAIIQSAELTVSTGIFHVKHLELKRPAYLDARHRENGGLARCIIQLVCAEIKNVARI